MNDIGNRLIFTIGLLFITSYLLAQENDTTYYEDGVISAIGSYDSKGREKGHWVYFWESGSKSREGKYSKGKSNGKWFFYGEDGALEEIGHYKKDRLLQAISPDGSKVTQTRIERMPEFPGGLDALMKYLGSSISYPDDAKQAGVEGKVYVSFVVGKEGGISNINIRRSVYPSIDKEVIRVIEDMPNWSPGLSYGRAVKVQYNLPVNFSLAN